ncbi:cyclic nucleotide-binding domain-containing protein [Chondromyces apiculatus]|uniref:cAMP-binding protein n=1 Tax=Chondromyces apiculatus DSM 436 TaxID=1192034 RepID=A0A017TD80_9BACT|nr:cyclic nucleotide-binding domain-containing protein [Chondromyces apiculatus]EYF06882.1 cAMP-binding protein [Chondromyces apiculatus DSM 436]
MNPKEFQKQLKALLLSPVDGMDWEDKLTRARGYLRQLATRANPQEESAELFPAVEILAFEPGKRPVDEAIYPGHGCSERAGLLSTAPDALLAGEDEVWILFRLRDIYAYLPPFQRSFAVTMSAWFLPPPGVAGEPVPVPGLMDVPLAPKVVASDAFPVPALADAQWSAFNTAPFVATIRPRQQLLPATLPAELEARTPDGGDPFTFAHRFHQALRVEVAFVGEGERLASAETELEVFDTGRFGSLYARLLDDLVRADLSAQQERLRLTDLHVGYHPWFPVLTIGVDKANLYLRAIHQDLAMQRRNLPDPRWLLRVGLYLELLTCLGIIEAVKDEYPDLLTPVERELLEKSPAYAPIREKLQVEAWQKVWELREIASPRGGAFSSMPVIVSNLRRKQRATLAFLHAHHEDLKAALELSGPNLGDGQETWHRVFRDAERAVLRNSERAFPELGYLDARLREFALWHQRGDMRLLGLTVLPEALTSLFGDQDGLYPSACRQYRRSMNDVARWAAQQGLMEYTGEECIPRNASLLEAQMEQNGRLLEALQRRDGYGQELEVAAPRAGTAPGRPEEVLEVLRRCAVFKPLMDRELRRLAQRARRAVYGPLDRVVVQGHTDASMFVVASGSVEVVVRLADGRDTPLATLEEGAIFGEIALLTGEERSATVRAVDEVVLYEITKEALQPIIEARPQLVVELARLMATRQAGLREAAGRAHEEEHTRSMAARIRRFFLG